MCTPIVFIAMGLIFVAYVASYIFYKKKKLDLDIVTHSQYEKDFFDKKDGVLVDKERLGRVVDAVLNIRKFEIDLYWKRATYFWAFIALAYTAYGLLEEDRHGDALEIEWFVVCLGLFLSTAWHLVNRGSKFWQENWENHLDLLETEYLGPLYKTVISRPRRGKLDLYRKTKDILVGPGAYSVSKINAAISAFNILTWGYLLARLIGWVPTDFRKERTVVVVATLVWILLMIIFTKTDNEHHLDLQAVRRETKIDPP